MKNQINRHFPIFLIAVFTLGIVIAMIYSFSLGRSMGERFTPQINAVMEIKLQATTAHLWFEEIISGDRFVNIDTVWKHLDQAQWYARAMLEGGENPKGKIVPLKDTMLQLRTEQVLDSIEVFRNAARERWNTRSQSGIGSKFDQRFDQTFSNFLILADEIEIALKLAMKNQLQHFHLVQSVLVVIVVILGTFLAIVLNHHEHRHMSNLKVLKEREDSLNTSNRLYAILSQVNQAILTEHDKQKLFQTICDIAVEFGKFSLAWIGMVDQENKRIKPVAFSGECADNLQNFNMSLTDDLTSNEPAGRAILEDNSVVINDLENNPEYTPRREQALRKSYGSLGAFPIRLNDRVIGVLNIFASEAFFFNKSEINLLEEMALNISFALKNIQREKDRKQAENKLRQSEKNLTEAQKIAKMGSWKLNLENNRLIWSDELYRIFEIDSQAFCPSYNTFIDAIHPEDQEIVNKTYSESVSDGTPYEIEHRILMKDGRCKYVIERCETHYDDKGKPLESIGTTLDITELQEFKNQALIKDNVLSSIFQVLPDLFFLMDMDGTIRDYRAREIEKLYIPPEDFIDKRMQDVMPQPVARLFEKNMALVEEQGLTTFEYDLEMSTGYKWFEARLSKLSDKKKIIAVIRDITKRKLNDIQLKEQLDELNHWHNATLGREGRIIELKQQVNSLAAKLEQTLPYPSVMENDTEHAPTIKGKNVPV